MPVGPGQETGVRASTRRSLDACSKPSPSSGFRFQRAEWPEMKQLDGWWWWWWQSRSTPSLRGPNDVVPNSIQPILNHFQSDPYVHSTEYSTVEICNAVKVSMRLLVGHSFSSWCRLIQGSIW